MILSYRQYRVTKAQLAELQDALEHLDKPAETQDTDPLLQKAQREGLQSQVDKLSEHVREYEARLDDLPF